MTITTGGPTVDGLWPELKERTAAGERFAGLSAVDEFDNSKKRWELSAYVARPGGVDILTVMLPPGAVGYPALTPRLNAAFWYERVIHDQTGITPEGHPRLAPLVRAGRPDDHALPRHVDGYGLFTIPHGPVRSGVFESMEYLVETPGEAIPHLNMRIFYKHRGLASRFEGASVADGVLLAERAEGIASVAHALAFCHAIETLSAAARRAGRPHRRRRRARESGDGGRGVADGHVVVFGPAARHRAAHPAARPRARRPRPRRQGVRLPRRRPRRPPVRRVCGASPGGTTSRNLLWR
jgi:respiratory-subunit NADH dehydrogenase subunit